MPVYAYKGLDKRGKATKGVHDSENARTLRSDLRKRDVYLTEYAEQSAGGKAKEAIRATGRKKTGASREVTFSFLDRVAPQTISEMTRMLATLLRSGVPLVDSLAALVEQTEDERLSRVLAQVRRQVNEGMALHQAMREHPKVFPGLYCNMVSAGEASGTLELVFQRLADFMEGQVKLRSQVTSALTYPAIMMTFAFLVVALLMIFVVPKLVEVIVEQGGTLPLPTRVLIGISDFFRSYFIFLVVGGIVGIVYFRRWTRTQSGELKWDAFKLRVPLFGDLMRKISIARFARTLGTLMASGVPLLTSIEICKHVVGNAVYREELETARVAIRDGDSIAGPLKRSPHFPPMITQMVAIGEKTGEVEEMLERVAEAYETQVETKVGRLTTLLEPAMIVFLGVIVAGIVFAVLLPMMKMNEALRGGG